MELIKLIIVLICAGFAMNVALDYQYDREIEIQFQEKLQLLERQR